MNPALHKKLPAELHQILLTNLDWKKRMDFFSASACGRVAVAGFLWKPPLNCPPLWTEWCRHSAGSLPSFVSIANMKSCFIAKTSKGQQRQKKKKKMDTVF